jgi:Leucine-rich repeat (LRR) protein
MLYKAVFTSKHAAVLAATSFSTVLPDQEQMDKVLMYLHKHGQHLETLDLTGTHSQDEPGWTTFNAFLPQLPYNNLQKLHILILTKMRLQILPGSGFQGVLGSAASSLTKLQISSCKVMEGFNDLEAALAHLPHLQHLSMRQNYVGGTERRFPLPVVAIGTLQQLTHLVLEGDRLQDADGLRHLQGLTSLEHLELSGMQLTIRASHLSEMRSLKYLKVGHNSDPNQTKRFCSSSSFEPGALAGKTQLQDVQLSHISIPGGSGSVGLLSHLQQQLTQTKTLIVDRLVPATPLCVTFEASIQLETVRISAKVSAQQVFTIAKQFPNLRALEVKTCCQGRALCDPTRHLVSCCPELQSLVTPGFEYIAEVVAQLSELSSLTNLSLRPDSNAWDAVCHLTRLRHLGVSVPAGKQGDWLQLLRQLTDLKELTCLDFRGRESSCYLTAVGFQPAESAAASAVTQIACPGNMRMHDVMPRGLSLKPQR